LTSSARERLAGFPEAVRGQFEFLLSAARQGSVLQEDHNYWIDTQVVYEVRRVVLEVGTRLALNGGIASADDVFHGMAGSPGVARGRARIIRSLAEGETFQHGEVLVAPTTAPPWTPLFARAAAIVTDAGGILRH